MALPVPEPARTIWELCPLLSLGFGIAALLLDVLHWVYGQDQVGDAAPQPAQLVRVHVVVGAGGAAAGELGPEEVPDSLLHLPEADVALQRVLLQQHRQQQGHILEGGALVVTVLVEDEGGPGGQQLEAVNHRGPAPGRERRAQL